MWLLAFIDRVNDANLLEEYGFQFQRTRGKWQKNWVVNSTLIHSQIQLCSVAEESVRLKYLSLKVRVVSSRSSLDL